MHHLFALFGVLVESSIRTEGLSLIITLSYLLYLVSFKSKRTISYMAVTALIFTLQSNRNSEVTILLFILITGILFLLLKQLEYIKSNLLFFVATEMVCYLGFSYLLGPKPTISWAILNFIGLFLVNFLFVKIKAREREN